MSGQHPTGFPIPADQFEGGSELTPGTTPAGRYSLEELIANLEAWVQTRGYVDVPGSLPATANDGDMIAVRNPSGPGSPPALFIYDADVTTWKNLLSTGLPGTHASTHKHGGADEVATATAAANVIPKTGAGGTLDIGFIPLGVLATTVCVGNDARLSDARTPLAHTHGNGDLTGASATPGAATIPISGAANELDTWGYAPTGGVGVVWAVAAPTTLRAGLDRIAAQLAIVGAAPIP